MKNLRISVPAVVVAAVVLYFSYSWFWPKSDEDIIFGHVDKIVELASKEGEESQFASIGRARDIEKFFVSNPHVDVGRPLPVIRDRDEITAIIHHFRASAQRLEVEVSGKELEITPEGDRAVLRLLATGSGEASGYRLDEARHLLIDWVRQEGDWLIEKVEVLAE